MLKSGFFLDGSNTTCPIMIIKNIVLSFSTGVTYITFTQKSYNTICLLTTIPYQYFLQR